MNSKSQNLFTFSLYQGNVKVNENRSNNSDVIFKKEVLLCEKIFDADSFNPFTRYSIDIRDILPRSITKLQKMLSKRGYEVVYDVGNDKEYDLNNYHRNMIKKYPKEWRDKMWYNPQPYTQKIEDKTIKGVPCRIGLYINDHPIVERIFYVDNYNPAVKHSKDIVDLVVDISDEIFYRIKETDLKNMWDDYDLINRKGFNINQIREMSTSKREYFISTLN